jgi:cytochrome c
MTWLEHVAMPARLSSQNLLSEKLCRVRSSGAFLRSFSTMRLPLITGAAVLLVMAYVRPGSGDRRDQAAIAMVDKASAYLLANGPEKAFATFDDESDRQFHDGEIYVFVRTLDGNTIAHGAIPVMIGQTDFNTQDVDGKRYNKELIEIAASAGSGWVHYRWPNPLDKKIESKSTFFRKVGDYVVCAGYYDR